MTQYGTSSAASRESGPAGMGRSLGGASGLEGLALNHLRAKSAEIGELLPFFRLFMSPAWFSCAVPLRCSSWSPAFAVPLFLTDCSQKENMVLHNDTVGTYRQPAAYKVQREMQTEEHFQAYFERKLSSTLGGEPQIHQENRQLHLSDSFQPLLGRFGKIIIEMFPVLNWLFSYQFREWILRDLHAGLSVGMFQIPQGLLGVWLTRLPLPNINGFLSAFCCSMTYVIFGTSHHIGSFSILNTVVIDILKTLTLNQTFSTNGSLDNFSDPTLRKEYMEALTLTASITFLTGIIQVAFAWGLYQHTCRRPLSAYLTAAALRVVGSQFSFIFDVMLDFHKGPLGIFYNLFCFLLVLPEANATSILQFLLGMAVLRVNTSIMVTYKHSPNAFPMELLLVSDLQNAIAIIELTESLNLSALSCRFVPPTLPDLSNLSKIILYAFSLAIVSYFLLVFAGERYASLHNYNIASNQELVAVGLCNTGSSFFKSFVVSCAISGTVIQEKTGGRTQQRLELVIALKLGCFFQMIPNGILAAVAVSNMIPFLEKFLDVPILWRRDKFLIAMGFTFFIITIRSHRMKMVVLGQIPNMNIYRSLSAREIESIKIFQCCSSISFANMNHFKTYLLCKHGAIRGFGRFSVTATGKSFMFPNTGITALIAGCHSAVIADFEKNDFFDSWVTRGRFFLTLHDAVLAALGKHQSPDELEPAAQGSEESLAEQHKERCLLLKKKDFFFSAKNSDNELLHEEPISDISRSAQNKAEPSSLQQYDTPPLQSDIQDPGWGKRWKYTSNP
ncbi:unnamed protein product [Bubo scandiacus]